VSEKGWHETASKLGGQSIYIKKDGRISAKINNKISNHPKFNIFDSRTANIGYVAMKILYKEHGLKYENSPDYNSVYILDLRSGQKNFIEYDKIIKKT
jgi:hypothetical protein